ncbi:MAG: tRNA (adenosine(37)-N6)-dimethylallyltransferase MiaA [Desulfovibrionaceae bacterium]|jgi:tRNA dimethylallyltransferase|nr:tRNA (adenosine(37)-N6)-dimethylallyltransferase MiaA [Desulfovibrionaceae bacterium]
MAASNGADSSRPSAFCIAGPTASGKSALALALAARLPVEIINVDSALVYRGMDIGTAKPTLVERAAAAHHLIDIRDPRQAYSAAEFARDAARLIDAIQRRGRHPVLVGGTMLYFKALLEGLHELPPADPAVRRQIDQRARQSGWPALHAELAQVDPATAARLAPGDSQRIQRALEVWQVAGRSLSSFHAAKKETEGGQRPSAMPFFSLEPPDRAWLHQRIARRFDAMLDGGLLDEVATLRARGDLSLTLPSMRCVGYRQAWEAFDAATPATALSAAQRAVLRERGIAATRQLAKRQLTWLRAMPRRKTLAADEGATPEALALAVLRGLPI